jgi:hypothetical protein
MVGSDYVFGIFRKDIETIINRNPEVRFVNKSEHGAYIQGTFSGKWWESNGDILSESNAKDYLKRLSAELILGWRQKYYLLQELLYQPQIEEMAKHSAELRRAFDDAFEQIYQSFAEELDWKPSQGVASGDLVYLLSDRFSGAKDPDCRDIMTRAKSLYRQKKTVLIINTVEHFSGEPVATDWKMKWDPPAELADANSVYYEDRPYPYFQLPFGYEELGFIKEFLTFTDKNRPERVLDFGKYSLVSRCLAEFLTVEQISGS